MKNSKNSLNNSARVLRDVPCSSPVLGAQVPNYLVGLLDDEQTEVVESHLLDCKHCRATYQAITRLREGGRRRRLAVDRNGQRILPEGEAPGRIDQEA